MSNGTQDFNNTALTFLQPSANDNSRHPLHSLMSKGSLDCQQGAMEWNNPYEAGTWQAYAWDKGHSSYRGAVGETMQ